MKKKLISLMVAALVFANVGGVVAAKNYDSLPQAVWTQTPNEDYIAIQPDWVQQLLMKLASIKKL